MFLALSVQRDKPIYEQIASQIKRQIAAGKLAPHQPLPSIRGLARDMRISVITTKRAYEELEADGFVYSIAGKGTFVSAAPPALIREEKRRQVQDLLAKAVEAAKENGIEKEVLTEMLAALYQEG